MTQWSANSIRNYSNGFLCDQALHALPLIISVCDMGSQLGPADKLKNLGAERQSKAADLFTKPF